MPFLKKKKFWFNIHLILSLVCVLPLLVVALSGAAISYHDELIEWINAEKSSVQEGERALSAREILEKFRAQQPNFTLSYFRVQNEPNAAVRVSGTDEGGEFRSYFVSPYTGEITGENYGDKLIGVALNLHVNLGLGLLKNETARLTASIS